jgi:hypothetical protein
MKKWILTINHNNQIQIISIWGKSKEEVKNKWGNYAILHINEDIDLQHQSLIANMKSNSTFFKKQETTSNFIREYYKCDIPDGILTFLVWRDKEDGVYYDSVQYIFQSFDSAIAHHLWTIISVEQFYAKFFNGTLCCEIPIYRFYGEPKMNKPKELKGIKQAFSTEWIYKKCTCPCFVKDNDLWIHHKDFFSRNFVPPDPKDIGTPTIYQLQKYFHIDKPYLKKFIYPDCWGNIVLRNEAWIVFRNFKQTIERDRHYPVSALINSFLQSSTIHKYLHLTQLNNDWTRFFENLIRDYKTYTKERII